MFANVKKRSVNYYLNVDTAYQFFLKMGGVMETAKVNLNHSH